MKSIVITALICATVIWVIQSLIGTEFVFRFVLDVSPTLLRK